MLEDEKRGDARVFFFCQSLLKSRCLPESSNVATGGITLWVPLTLSPSFVHLVLEVVGASSRYSSLDCNPFPHFFSLLDIIITNSLFLVLSVELPGAGFVFLLGL